MFTNILIPTDGTELSARAAAHAVGLAGTLGARVTAVTVSTPGDGIMIGDIPVVMKNSSAYQQHAATHAEAMLEVVARIAREANVPCEVVHARHSLPWQGILTTAKTHAADLIVMASHGRRGLSAVLVGSETRKVVANSAIPVLVYR